MKTKSGFEFDIDPEILDDMELVDALAEVEDNPLAFSKVVTMLLGNDKKRLYAHIKETKGLKRVPIEAVGEIVEEIFDTLNEKNS